MQTNIYLEELKKYLYECLNLVSINEILRNNNLKIKMKLNYTVMQYLKELTFLFYLYILIYLQ